LPVTLFELFRTPTQVKIIEELLKRPMEYFTISRMAKIIDASPSAVSAKVISLEKLGLIRFVGGSEKAKIFYLNRDSQLVKILIDFFNRISRYDP